MLDVGEAGGQASIGELGDFYRAARAKFDGDPKFADRARERVVRLQAGDERTLALWVKLVELSQRYFASVYERFGIGLRNEDVRGESAYNAGTAELWVARVDGSIAPIKLTAANVGAGLTNSWARWAPFEGSFGETEEPIFWLTFSSKREFGVRLAAGRPQLWMTPFFPERAAIGADPTAPAFRLPFQNLDSSNHIAQWTTQVVPVE